VTKSRNGFLHASRRAATRIPDYDPDTGPTFLPWTVNGTVNAIHFTHEQHLRIEQNWNSGDGTVLQYFAHDISGLEMGLVTMRGKQVCLTINGGKCLRIFC
jgi:hypothetical protein